MIVSNIKHKNFNFSWYEEYYKHQAKICKLFVKYFLKDIVNNYNIKTEVVNGAYVIFFLYSDLSKWSVYSIEFIRNLKEMDYTIFNNDTQIVIRFSLDNNTFNIFKNVLELKERVDFLEKILYIEKKE